MSVLSLQELSDPLMSAQALLEDLAVLKIYTLKAERSWSVRVCDHAIESHRLGLCHDTRHVQVSIEGLTQSLLIRILAREPLAKILELCE